MMRATRTNVVTTELDDFEYQALVKLCLAQGMNESAVLRNAFRLYQSWSDKQADGARLAVIGKDGKEIRFPLLCDPDAS